MFAFTLALLLASPPAAASGPGWTDVSPKDGGFAVQMPGTPRPDSKRPGRIAVENGNSSWIVEFKQLDSAIGGLVQSGNRKGVARILETLRDGTVNGMKAKVITSETADFEGSPSIFFTFAGASDGKPVEGTERIVLTAERMYIVVAIGAKGAMKGEDVDRFFLSFRLGGAAPEPAIQPGTFRTVAYLDAVCGRMPPVPVTFSMPGDYVSRAVGGTAEGGCLSGTKDDLDRVTAVPFPGARVDQHRL